MFWAVVAFSGCFVSHFSPNFLSGASSGLNDAENSDVRDKRARKRRRSGSKVAKSSNRNAMTLFTSFGMFSIRKSHVDDHYERTVDMHKQSVNNTLITWRALPVCSAPMILTLNFCLIAWRFLIPEPMEDRLWRQREYLAVIGQVNSRQSSTPPPLRPPDFIEQVIVTQYPFQT